MQNYRYAPIVRYSSSKKRSTSMFLHIGFSHLASNMWALFFTGSALERIYGHGRFLVVYIVSGLCGSILSAVSIPAGVVAAGASGAILGTLAALIILQLRFSRFSLGFGLGSAILSLSYNILSGFVPSSGIDNAAHLGGAIGGALLSVFITPPALALVSQMTKDADALRETGMPRSQSVVLVEHDKASNPLASARLWLNRPLRSKRKKRKRSKRKKTNELQNCNPLHLASLSQREPVTVVERRCRPPGSFAGSAVEDATSQIWRSSGTTQTEGRTPDHPILSHSLIHRPRMISDMKAARAATSFPLDGLQQIPRYLHWGVYAERVISLRDRFAGCLSAPHCWEYNISS